MNATRHLKYPRTILRSVAALIALVLAFSWNLQAMAAEHPKEHPSSDKMAASKVTLDDVADYVRDYVKENSQNGVFKATDKVAGKQLSLTLDKVHRERLSQVGPNMYFVCADFKTVDGDKVYDLDLFVQGTSKNNLSVVPGRTTVHKEDGKARYTWVLNEQTEDWEQHPAGESVKAKAGGKAEHPKKEHPSGH